MMRKGIWIIVFTFVIGLYFIVNNKPDYDCSKDEIGLKIQLDLKEDIGLLAMDYEINGTIKGKGGTSNTDKTLIKKDELLYCDLVNKGNDISGKVKVTINFSIISEYIQPNYDNNYPDELTVELEAISFIGEFSKVYSISITGSIDEGYVAVFNNK